MTKTLTQTEIDALVKYHQNMSQRLEGHSKPTFTNEQTLQILNAVTELKETTEDEQWTIKYFDDGKRFFVKPGPKHRGKSTQVPCGNYITEWAMSRLEL